MFNQFADIAEVGYWSIILSRSFKPGFLRRGLTKALVKDSGTIPSLSEVFIMSDISAATDGRICFNNAVRIGLSVQFLFSVKRIIFGSSGRVIGWKLLRL